MSYRPEGWENPYKDWFGMKETTLREEAETLEHFAYEAGADAMLEALRKRGTKLDGRPLAIPRGNIGDIVVFIPDEEEN